MDTWLMSCRVLGRKVEWSMLDALGDARPTGIDPSGVAETLFLAVPNGRAANPEE